MSKMKATYGEPKDNYSAKIRIKSTVLVIWFIILTVICLLPIYILIINATREHKDIANSLSFIPGTHFFKNLETINTNPTMKMAYDAFHGYKNSLIITVLSCFLTVFFSAMTAYGIHVYDFKLKDISYTVILLVMMVPMQVTSAGFVSFMADLHLTNTKIPLILPAIAAPSVVYFMRSYMKSSFPLDIVEAARIDGTGEFRTFLTIGLPMMKPAIGVQAIFAFIANWNNFYTPSMILVSREPKQYTMPMMVQSILSNDKLSDMGVRYTAIMLSILPVMVIYILLSRTIVEGVAEGGVKE